MTVMPTDFRKDPVNLSDKMLETGKAVENDRNSDDFISIVRSHKQKLFVHKILIQNKEITGIIKSKDKPEITRDILRKERLSQYD